MMLITGIGFGKYALSTGYLRESSFKSFNQRNLEGSPKRLTFRGDVDEVQCGDIPIKGIHLKLLLELWIGAQRLDDHVCLISGLDPCHVSLLGGK